MTGDLRGLRAAVVGSGIFGLASAVRLALSGAEVVIYDPAALGDSASGVAAGMLAPAFESALDPPSAGHFQLLRQGREAWPRLLDLAGAPAELIDRSGAFYLAQPELSEAVRGRLVSAGAAVERLPSQEAVASSSGLTATGEEALFSPEDWRIDPGQALAALQRAFLVAGGRIETRRLRFADGQWTDDAADPLRADAVVLAAGAEARALADAAPECAVLQPIKGQIVAFEAGPSEGPVVRSPGGYVAPQARGAVAGATMEAGRADRIVDPAAVARLRAEAERLYPGLVGASATARAGVRATTPDGLPMVGPTAGAANLVLAVGARRNGWLLAPLVAEVVLRTLAGEGSGEVGAAFSPARSWR